MIALMTYGCLLLQRRYSSAIWHPSSTWLWPERRLWYLDLFWLVDSSINQSINIRLL